MKCLLLATTLLIWTATGFGANWPARVFAPYMYIGAGDNFKIARCADVSGQKFYTIASLSRISVWIQRGTAAFQ